MQRTKNSGALVREDCMEKSGIVCYSPYRSTNCERRSHSVSEFHEDILNATPRLSQHNRYMHLERRLYDRDPLYHRKMTSQYSSSKSMASTEISLQKPASEIIKEIATIEHEVINLERYLLSLYRTAFDQYLSSSPTATTHTSRSPVNISSRSLIQIEHHSSHAVKSNHNNDQMSLSQSNEGTEMKSVIHYQSIEDSSANALTTSSDTSCSPPGEDPKHEMQKSTSGHRSSLAEHLGASISDHVPQTASKLSEDIIKCIAAIYCKLANPPTQQIELLDSPTTSASSASTFSQRDPCDSWSPGCHYEAATSPQFDSPKVKQSPYKGMVEVPKISVDSDKFGYASKMLNIFRSLIRRLETIDPRKMQHEEQLAFWINIHNALVMHAFLAYGLHQNHMKSTFSILKAAYNVGGHSVNAYVIQSSILGCQVHRPASGILALFSPAIKQKKGRAKHIYALVHPEPLAHFALCLGAHSDPAVRVYTAKSISQELKLAKREFIQANVCVQKGTKIILPKILHYYARDASLELSDLVEIVRECMPDAQRKAIKACLHRKPEKCVEWSLYRSSFRYLVHRDLAKQ